MGSSLVLLLSAAAAAGSPPAGELRGLWVVRTGLTSPASVDRVVDEAREGGFNTLFVQVRGRGDALYESTLVPRSPLLAGRAGSFDPLRRLIGRARAAGIEVHGWVNVLLTSHFPAPPADNLVVRHPEWVMVPRQAARPSVPKDPRGLLWLVRRAARSDPDVEGYYLSPSSPEVRAHLEAIVRELVRKYPLRGIHLDFIRYPNKDYDWSTVALEDFRHQEGGGDLLTLPESRPEAFENYRRRVLTGLATRLAAAAREERPGIVVSAAVVPDEASALHQRFQDWPDWLDRGILDAVCPMTYTPDTRLFLAQVEGAGAKVRPGQRVWAGVGAYRLSVDGMVEKILAARRAGASGVVLFSHESLTPSALRRLATEAFAP